MRIAIVYDRIYPFAIGGGEKRNWEVARRLVQRGHTVELVGMRYWAGDVAVEREGVRLVGVCQAMAEFNDRGKRSFLQPLALAAGLWRYLQSRSFDVIECANFPYLTCFVARLTASRNVGLSICWFEARGLSGWWSYQRFAGLAAYPLELLASRVTKFNTAISITTKRRAEKLLRIKPEHIEMIPCGVDNRHIRAYSCEKKVEQLVYVGRLVQHKRVDVALRAFAIVQLNMPRLTFKIIGQGDREPALRRLAAELRIAEQVRFIPKLDAEALIIELARSQLFLFPSEQEGFGLVIVEAMAAGTPVIALDAPLSAANTIIADRVDGFLARDGRDFPRLIETALNDPNLYANIRNNGLRKAAEYDWDTRVVPALERHYGAVVAGRQANRCS